MNAALNDSRPVEILLVEDNPGDIMLTQQAFKQARLANNIHVARDGESALEMLYKQGEYTDMVTPDIVLLDLNLPKKDGREVLEEVKEDAVLKHIPVVVLSSSKADQDVIKTYNLHANSYIIKPVNMEKFFEVVSAIEHFWFTVVTLPKEQPAERTG